MTISIAAVKRIR